MQYEEWTLPSLPAIAAARAIMEAKARNDFSLQALSRCEKLLKQSCKAEVAWSAQA
jgi:flavin-dependent dehydrogenase